LEQRRHPRLYLHLPIRFVVEQPDTHASQNGQGILKDISYGGVFFRAEPPLPVQLGHVRDFSFFLMPDNQTRCELTHFRAQGLVRRIDPPAADSTAYGVAVQFRSALRMKDVTTTMTISNRQ